MRNNGDCTPHITLKYFNNKNIVPIKSLAEYIYYMLYIFSITACDLLDFCVKSEGLYLSFNKEKSHKFFYGRQYTHLSSFTKYSF